MIVIGNNQAFPLECVVHSLRVMSGYLIILAAISGFNIWYLHCFFLDFEPQNKFYTLVRKQNLFSVQMLSYTTKNGASLWAEDGLMMAQHWMLAR